MKPHEWHERGTRADDPIQAFSNFWRAFNNLYFCNSDRQERQKIQIFLHQDIGEDNAPEILFSYSGSIEFLLSEPVIDMRDNGKKTPRETSRNSQEHRIRLPSLGRLLWVSIRSDPIWNMVRNHLQETAMLIFARMLRESLQRSSKMLHKQKWHV